MEVYLLAESWINRQSQNYTYFMYEDELSDTACIINWSSNLMCTRKAVRDFVVKFVSKSNK